MDNDLEDDASLKNIQTGEQINKKQPRARKMIDRVV